MLFILFTPILDLLGQTVDFFTLGYDFHFLNCRDKGFACLLPFHAYDGVTYMIFYLKMLYLLEFI